MKLLVQIFSTFLFYSQVLFRGDERIYWNYLLHSKFPGEAVKALILRSGKKVQIEIKLDTYRHLVPRHLYEKTPRYFSHQFAF